MNLETINSFVTHYLHGLHERTRREKSGTKWGLDWVIYNLGLARFGKPVRLPFLRSGGLDYSKSKVEAEFGIDLAFVSEDRRELVIFVLKDEPLTNRTWTSNDFDRDLRMAMAPDLGAESLERVASVTVILAYNKDDEQNGVELYERLVANAPVTLRDNVAIKFVRWNLSDLVEQTIGHILSPSLVPERLFGQLSYLAAQVADFTHGSDAWEQQPLPNWRRFVDDVLQESSGARGPALLPVVLIILKQHARANPSFATGWIDLIEWAAIALWNRYATHREQSVLKDVQRFWTDFYIAEIESFYRSHMGSLGTEHSVDQLTYGSYEGAVAAGWVAFWHIGRLGLLSLQASEESHNPIPEKEDSGRVNETADWMAMLLNANVAVYRPVLDIQHIEVFLVAECFRNVARLGELGMYIGNLQSRLYLRRLGASELPFLDGANSLQNVFEQVATKPADSLVLSKSSFFVLSLLELCCLLPPDDRDELVATIHSRLVLGALDQGKPGDRKPLDLMSWIPPADWVRGVFAGRIDHGEAVVVHRFADTRDASSTEILSAMCRVVAEMSKVRTLDLPADIPLAALVLACLRYGSPLPPELWRRFAFPESPPTVDQ
jgi:hypothetical protein